MEFNSCSSKIDYTIDSHTRRMVQDLKSALYQLNEIKRHIYLYTGSDNSIPFEVYNKNYNFILREMQKLGYKINITEHLHDSALISISW